MDVVLIELGLIVTSFGDTAADSIGNGSGEADGSAYGKFNKAVGTATAGIYEGPAAKLGGPRGRGQGHRQGDFLETAAAPLHRHALGQAADDTAPPADRPDVGPADAHAVSGDRQLIPLHERDCAGFAFARKCHTKFVESVGQLGISLAMATNTHSNFPDARGSGQARDALTQLEPQLPEHVVPDMTLLVSELITNGVKYGGDGPVRLEITQDEGRIRTEIVDQGVGFTPVERDGDLSRVGGWDCTWSRS